MILTDEILLQHVLDSFEKLFPDLQQLSRTAAQEGSNNAGLGTAEAGDSEDES